MKRFKGHLFICVFFQELMQYIWGTECYENVLQNHTQKPAKRECHFVF